MLVSIIIRTKNEENWIKALIYSLLEQTQRDFEIILVDNGSTDKTVSVFQSLCTDVKYSVVYIDKYLPGLALQQGIDVASGDIYVFLSSHCIPANIYWLENLISPLKNAGIVASYGRQLPTSASGPDDTRDLLMVFGSESIIQSTDFKFHNANSAILKSYYQNNPFDSTVTNIEDWYWAKDAINSGNKIAYNSDAAVYHQHGINQHINNASFRSDSVSKKLTNLYDLNIKSPFFEDANFWEGLVVISLPENLDPVNISDIPIDMDRVFTSHSNNADLKILPSKSFDEYLLDSLEFAEVKYKKNYDYLIFIDLHYNIISFDNIADTVSNLFKSWADVSTPARLVKSFVFDGEMKTKRVIKNSSSNLISRTELLLGQGSAMRTSVIRRLLLKNCYFSVSCYLDRKYIAKDSWNDS